MDSERSSTWKLSSSLEDYNSSIREDALQSMDGNSASRDAKSLQSMLVRLAVVAKQASAADAVTVHSCDAGSVFDDITVGVDSLVSFSTEQLQLGIGPSCDAMRTNATVVTHSVQEDSRWPELTEKACAQDVGGMLAIPLHVEGALQGVLTFFPSSTQSFIDPEDFRLRILVDCFCILLANKRAYEDLAREADSLAVAIASRGVIEQAKGMIMCVEKCTEEEAFNRLKELSQHSNVKLRELAAGVVERMSRPTG